jgi:hypothetical protein
MATAQLPKNVTMASLSAFHFNNNAHRYTRHYTESCSCRLLILCKKFALLRTGSSIFKE